MMLVGAKKLRDWLKSKGKFFQEAAANLRSQSRGPGNSRGARGAECPRHSENGNKDQPQQEKEEAGKTYEPLLLTAREDWHAV